MKLNVIFTLVFLSGCTVLTGCTMGTEKNYIHRETAHYHWRVVNGVCVNGVGDIELAEPVVFVPNFRTFSWDHPSRPSLIILSKTPVEVHIQSATLAAPGGSPEKTLEVDWQLSVTKKRDRSTTFGERIASGGFFKGKRMIDTDVFVARHTFEFTPAAFNTYSPLRFEVVASVDGAPYKTHSFKIIYRERTSPQLITR